MYFHMGKSNLQKELSLEVAVSKYIFINIMEHSFKETTP